MFKSSQPSPTTIHFSQPYHEETSTSPGWFERLWRVQTLFVAILFIGCIHVVGLSILEIVRVQESHARMAQLERDIALIEAELVDLQAVIAHESDQGFLEQLARQQGFAYPDETLIRTFDAQGNAVIVNP